MASTYGEEADPECMAEDYVWSTLGTAKVKRVLLSNPSVQPAEQCYWEPSLD